jgi:hypothetical protein
MQHRTEQLEQTKGADVTLTTLRKQLHFLLLLQGSQYTPTLDSNRASPNIMRDLCRM